MCNPSDPKPAQDAGPLAEDPKDLLPGQADVRLQLANKCLRIAELATDLIDKLVGAENTITRLEAGESRFTCRQCGSQVWSTDGEPPPSWRQFKDFPSGRGYLCQDCADQFYQSCADPGTGPARP